MESGLIIKLLLSAAEYPIHESFLVSFIEIHNPTLLKLKLFTLIFAFTSIISPSFIVTLFNAAFALNGNWLSESILKVKWT